MVQDRQAQLQCPLALHAVPAIMQVHSDPGLFSSTALHLAVFMGGCSENNGGWSHGREDVEEPRAHRGVGGTFGRPQRGAAVQESALPGECGKVRVRVRARAVVRMRLRKVLRRGGDLADEAVADEVVPWLKLPCTTQQHALQACMLSSCARNHY